MADGIIEVSAEDRAFIESVKNSGTGLYRAYDRLLPYLQKGTGQYFWFEQAALINRAIAFGISVLPDVNIHGTMGRFWSSSTANSTRFFHEHGLTVSNAIPLTPPRL